MLYSKLKRIAKIVITVGVLLLLIYIIRNNYNEIKQYDFNIHISYLSISFATILIATLLLPVIWYKITRHLNCDLGFYESLRIRLISEIGKYIPGRVFGYGYLILHYKEAGKDQIKVLNSSIYELFLTTFSAFLFFTFTLLFTSFQVFNAYKVGFVVISIFGIFSVHPWFFQKMSDLFCNLFKKEKIRYQISYSKMLILLALYLLFWLIFSLAFFFFVRAFTEVTFANIPYLSGSFALSTFAGFMAFFLPAGLGAREGLLIYLLGAFTGNTIAIVVSIGSRLWLIAGDIILFLCALGTKIYADKNQCK